MSLQGANSGIGLVSDRLVLREFPHRRRRGAFPGTRRDRPLTPAGPTSPPGEGVAPYLLVVALPLEAGDVVLAHGVVGVALVRI
jgi:hypothetical protein